MWKTSLMQKCGKSILSRQSFGSDSSQNSYQLLPNAISFLDDVVGVIDTATSSIDMQFYTFENDDTGHRISQALIRAHRNNVKVRLMIDASINLAHNDHYIYVPRFNRRLQKSLVQKRNNTRRLLKEMNDLGIQVKIINPLGAMMHRMFLRDHKKIVLIDGNVPDSAVAYIGGINVSDHNAAWNDFMVKMGGEMIPLLQADFDRTWFGRNLGGVAEYDDGLMVADTRRRPLIIPVVKHLIDLAHHKVMIETPFLRSKRIERSLIEAAERSVNVSVTVPLDNKALFVPKDKLLDRLANAGVHVYRFEGGTHAKALLADNVGLFGSSNFNNFLSRKVSEIGIVTDNVGLTGQLERFMTNSICRSVRHGTC